MLNEEPTLINHLQLTIDTLQFKNIASLQLKSVYN